MPSSVPYAEKAGSFLYKGVYTIPAFIANPAACYER